MKSKTTSVLLLLLFVLLAAGALAGCDSGNEPSTDTTTAITGNTTTTSQTAATTEAETPAGPQTLSIGDVADVEQGTLSVATITVTDDLTSDEANQLLLTGAQGEKDNAPTAAAAGNEFLLITFAYSKAEWYEFRGGVYPEDLILKDAEGIEYPVVETHGFGGLHESDAGDVKPGSEGRTTAVFEVPKGKTGLVLVYHTHYPDAFNVSIR